MRTQLSFSRKIAASVAFVALVASPAFAQTADDAVAKLYDVEMKATPNVAKGADGQLVVRITPKAGAEIHKEAPISLSLETKGVKTGKNKLGRPELLMEGENGSFTVPFTAVSPGAATIDANLTFFVCTDNLCARQQRKVQLPVTVGS